MKIGLDVMGGDFAPDAPLDGALLALESLPQEDKIVLIGPEEVIQDGLRQRNADPGAFDIIHAPDVIGMGDQPIKSFTTKSESSIAVGFKMIKKGVIDTFASAGNSGAMLVGSIYSVGNIPGVIRPCTAGLIPRINGGLSMLIDIGTNPDARTDVLYQFAIIGSIYASSVFGIAEPRIGLLNIGEEEEKGNLLCQAAFPILKDSRDFNFIGNIEGRDLFSDKCDVIVCDGYTGNIVIKQIESIYEILTSRGIKDDFIDKLDYEHYGGSPILGINGTVLIGHGISNGNAIRNMIKLSAEVHRAELHKKILQAFKLHTLNNNDKE